MAPNKTIAGFVSISLFAVGCASRPDAPAPRAPAQDAATPAQPAWAAAARFSDGLCNGAHADASVVLPLYA